MYNLSSSILKEEERKKERKKEKRKPWGLINRAQITSRHPVSITRTYFNRYQHEMWLHSIQSSWLWSAGEWNRCLSWSVWGALLKPHLTVCQTLQCYGLLLQGMLSLLFSYFQCLKLRPECSFCPLWFLCSMGGETNSKPLLCCSLCRPNSEVHDLPWKLTASSSQKAQAWSPWNPDQLLCDGEGTWRP